MENVKKAIKKTGMKKKTLAGGVSANSYIRKEFLKLEELPKVLSLNKTYNESLLKIVYKNILIKYRDMDLKTHIAIWKIILGYSKVKKDYNYQKVLEQIKQIQQEANAKDIITLDVKRTNFENDKEKSNGILLLGGFDGENYMDSSLVFNPKEMKIRDCDIVIPNMSKHSQFLFHKESAFIEFDNGAQYVFDSQNNVHLLTNDSYELFSEAQ